MLQNTGSSWDVRHRNRHHAKNLVLRLRCNHREKHDHLLVAYSILHFETILYEYQQS